jgi:hypothetical protein
MRTPLSSAYWRRFSAFHGEGLGAAGEHVALAVIGVDGSADGGDGVDVRGFIAVGRARRAR